MRRTTLRTPLPARLLRGGGFVASALMLGSAAPSALASGVPHPKPGAVFAGRPAGFQASDDMHWRVSNNGRSMRLVGSFFWSYGCQVTGTYGIADAAELRKDAQAPIAVAPAPAIFIHKQDFLGSLELVSRVSGKRYGRFKISGQFTGTGSTARVTFSFSDPPACDTVLTRSFELRG